MAFGLLLQTTAWALLAWSRWNEKQQIMSGIWRKVPKNPAVPKPFVFVPSKGGKNSLLFCLSLFLSIARIFYVDDTSQQMTSGSIKWKKRHCFGNMCVVLRRFSFLLPSRFFALYLLRRPKCFPPNFSWRARVDENDEKECFAQMLRGRRSLKLEETVCSRRLLSGSFRLYFYF